MYYLGVVCYGERMVVEGYTLGAYLFCVLCFLLPISGAANLCATFVALVLRISEQEVLKIRHAYTRGLEAFIFSSRFDPSIVCDVTKCNA